MCTANPIASVLDHVWREKQAMTTIRFSWRSKTRLSGAAVPT
jgi:hypothetical protein